MLREMTNDFDEYKQVFQLPYYQLYKSIKLIHDKKPKDSTAKTIIVYKGFVAN